MIGRESVGNDAREDFKIQGAEPDRSKPEPWSLGEQGGKRVLSVASAELEVAFKSRDFAKTYSVDMLWPTAWRALPNLCNYSAMYVRINYLLLRTFRASQI